VNKVRIPNCEDRATMVSILATAGYVVWIEEEKGESILRKNYYVCWKEKESEVEHGD
jgi:hypothetical protein